MLEIRGKKSFLSAIATTAEGETVIGEDAYRAGSVESLHTRFKSMYLTDPEMSEKHIRRFAKAVYEELERAGRIPERDKACFFVGCPSGWSHADREAYRRVLESAGFPNVTVVPESRAAFMYARESHELHISGELLTRSVLIIDAGSSTTDFTGVVDMREVEAVSASDFGETRLGGGLIERALFQINVRRNERREELESILNAYPQYAARGELEARRVKELYFTSIAGNTQHVFPCESSFKIYYKMPPLTVDITCTQTDMAEILNIPMAELGGKSVLSAFKASMAYARDAMRDYPPQTILLTGGASRMGFIYDMAQEMFKDAEIMRGIEPEYAIARGLCHTLKIHRKTTLFRGCVDELIAKDTVENIVLSLLPELLLDISGTTADEIGRIAVESFASWRGGLLETFDDVESEITRNIEAFFRGEEIKERLKPAVESWLEKVRPRVEAVTDPICDLYDIPRASLRLPGLIEVAAVPVELDSVFGLEGARVILDLIVASITAMVIGGSGMFLIPGPVGLIVGFGVGLLASRVSTGFAVKRVRRAQIPRPLRMLFPVERFRRGLLGKREQIVKSVYDQFNLNIEEGSENIERLVNGFAQSIEQQLGRMADSAAIMIR